MRVGISSWIREEAEGTPVLFECPAAVERRLRRRKAIRDLADVQPAIALRMLQDLWDQARHRAHGRPVSLPP